MTAIFHRTNPPRHARIIPIELRNRLLALPASPAGDRHISNDLGINKYNIYKTESNIKIFYLYLHSQP